MQYTIKEAGHLRDIPTEKLKNQAYPKKIIGLSFTSGEVAEWYADADEPIPGAGSIIEGEIKPGKFGGFSFYPPRKYPGGTGSPSQGPQSASSGGWSDEKDARITRLAAQKAAIELVKTYPEKFKDANTQSGVALDNLRGLIDWFVADAVPTENSVGQPTLNDTLVTPPAESIPF